MMLGRILMILVCGTKGGRCCAVLGRSVSRSAKCSFELMEQVLRKYLEKRVREEEVEDVLSDSRHVRNRS